jgi:hypothetical protein
MKAPTREPLYVNPTLQGGSNIADVPMRGNVTYNYENPNIAINEFGEQVLIETPKPTSTNTNTPSTKDFLNETLSNVKDAVKDIVSPPADPNAPKKDFGSILADNKAIGKAKTTTPKKTINYILYGALGIGAVVVVLGVLKKK